MPIPDLEIRFERLIHPESLILGHGWVFLEPFSHSLKPIKLRRILFDDSSKQVIELEIFLEEEKANVFSKGKLSLSQKDFVLNEITRVLRLEEDFSDFLKVWEKENKNLSLPSPHAGALLRSPTVFEDVVKTICTTNCSWTNTRMMVSNLCKFGKGSFPSPKQLVEIGKGNLKEKVRAGYRADYLFEFAKRIVDKELNPESWDTLSISDSRSIVSGIRGVGQYALDHIMFLLGDYSGIPVDSEVTSWIKKNYGEKAGSSPNSIRRIFEPYGKWSFLAYKFTRIAMRDNYVN